MGSLVQTSVGRMEMAGECVEGDGVCSAASWGRITQCS